MDKYFNAGFLILNVKLWKENNIDKEIFSTKPKTMLYADQEILNSVFENLWFELPSKYNVPANHLKISRFAYKDRKGNIPHVIHYISGIKPWKFWVNGSLVYWYYLIKTPYKSNIAFLPRTILNSIKHLIKK